MYKRLPIAQPGGLARYALAVALIVTAAGPRPVEGQIWKRVKDRVAEEVAKKAVDREARSESTAVKTVTKMADSTLEKSGRALDTGFAKVGVAGDTVINRTEGVMKSAFAAAATGGTATRFDRLAADLAPGGPGRSAMPEIAFAKGTDRLTPPADSVIRHVAAVIAATSGALLIEGHTDASGNAADDQVLSENRAAAVKARLVALGIAESRLFTLGYGSTRPMAGAPQGASSRIELVRMK